MGVVYVIKVFKLKLPPSIEQTVGTCTGVFAKDYMVYKKNDQRVSHFLVA